MPRSASPLFCPLEPPAAPPLFTLPPLTPAPSTSNSHAFNSPNFLLPFHNPQSLLLTDYDLHSPVEHPQPSPNRQPPLLDNHYNDWIRQATSPPRPAPLSDMAPRARRADGFIDLTQSSSPPRQQQPTPPASSRKRQRTDHSLSPGASQSSSRQGQEDSSQSKRPRRQATPPEEIDLVDVDDDEALELALRKQREEAVRQQAETSNGGESKQSTFSTMQCIICLDDPKDICFTPCGHLFCHSCLNEALAAGEGQGPKMSRCPICRTHVKRANIKPIELKLKVKSRPIVDAMNSAAIKSSLASLSACGA